MLFKKHIPPEIHRSYNLDFTSGIFSGLSLGLTAPFFAVIARRIGASPSQVALIMAAPFIGCFFSLYWAHMAERATKKRHIFYAGALSKACLFAMPLIFAPTPFVIVVFVSQFITALVIPAYAGVMNLIYPDEHRGKAMGYVRVGALFATMLATYLGGKWLDVHQFSYRWVFPAGAVFGILASYVFRQIDVVEKKDPLMRAEFNIGEIWKIVKGNAMFRKFEFGYFFFGFGNLMALTIYPLFAVDMLRLSNFTVGKLAAFGAIMSMVGMIFWGRYIDRKGPFKLLGRNILMIAFVPTLYCIAKDVRVLYAATFFAGLGFSGLELLEIATIIGISKKTDVPKYMALHTTLMGIRGTIAPFAAISIAHIFGLRGVLFISAAIIVIGGVSVSQIFHGKHAEPLMP